MWWGRRRGGCAAANGLIGRPDGLGDGRVQVEGEGLEPRGRRSSPSDGRRSATHSERRRNRSRLGQSPWMLLLLLTHLPPRRRSPSRLRGPAAVPPFRRQRHTCMSVSARLLALARARIGARLLQLPAYSPSSYSPSSAIAIHFPPANEITQPSPLGRRDGIAPPRSKGGGGGDDDGTTYSGVPFLRRQADGLPRRSAFARFRVRGRRNY